MDSRPTWQNVWMSVALIMSERSKCSRASVGSVIVSEDQRIVATGYNGPPVGFDAEGPCTNWCPRSKAEGNGSPTYDDCPSVHAEANAIIRSDPKDLKGATIYTTSSICKGCAKIVANSGIVQVVHPVDDIAYPYRSNDETEKFLRDCGIYVVRWQE